MTHLRRERVDVGELLGGVREYYEASAADGGVSLTTTVADEPVIAELDRTLLQRAVGNLVSNALAHTPPGGAVVLGTKRRFFHDSHRGLRYRRRHSSGSPAEGL